MVAERPLLLIDVDGVLSLFGFDAAAPPDGLLLNVDGIPHWLSKQAAGHLAALAEHFECVWCTGWEEKAEEHLAPALGLRGGWRHLTLGQGRDGRHWKLGAIEAFADPHRPLAWVDDTHDESCDDWLATRPGPTLLIRTEPALGLTDEHVARLVEWAGELGAPAGAPSES